MRWQIETNTSTTLVRSVEGKKHETGEGEREDEEEKRKIPLLARANVRKEVTVRRPDQAICVYVCVTRNESKKSERRTSKRCFLTNMQCASSRT